MRKQMIPVARWKHAATIFDNKLYLMGGCSNIKCLKDLWSLDLLRLHKATKDYIQIVDCWNILDFEKIDDQLWTNLSDFQGQIVPLQSHTIIGYEKKLYIFGGSFTNDLKDCPLWIYDIDRCTMIKWKNPITDNIKYTKQFPFKVSVPTPRRNHSCSIYRHFIIIFGGFGDVRGSLNDLWAFNIEKETWNLIWPHQTSNTTTNNQTGCNEILFGPSPRHSHHTTVYKNNLYVCGGMNGLEICKFDVWRWDFVEYQWTRLISKPTPLDLINITQIKIHSKWIFYGANESKQKTEKWIYSFHQNKWILKSYTSSELNSKSYSNPTLPQLSNNMCLTGHLNTRIKNHPHQNHQIVHSDSSLLFHNRISPAPPSFQDTDLTPVDLKQLKSFTTATAPPICCNVNNISSVITPAWAANNYLSILDEHDDEETSFIYDNNYNPHHHSDNELNNSFMECDQKSFLLLIGNSQNCGYLDNYIKIQMCIV